jgi:ribonuclease HI
MKIYIDGACSPNPGHGRAVAIVEKTETSSRVKLTKKLQDVTNNIAEYNALLLALEYIKSNVLGITMERKPKQITIYTDSKLINGHMNESWKVNVNIALVTKSKKLLHEIKETGIEIIIKWVPREKNIAGVMIENGEI